MLLSKMIALLLVLAVLAGNFSNLHEHHVEAYLEPQGNLKFKSLSVKHKLNFEYAKLNSDAVIARSKKTTEIEVFTTENEPLEDYDMKLIRDFTSCCVPLNEYEFAGDFDKRTGGSGFEPKAVSYIVAMKRTTKQTFGDEINILKFQKKQEYTRWCKENPAKCQRDKKDYFEQYPNDKEADYELYEAMLIESPQLYRSRGCISCEPYERVLKFSELSQDPQDLLQKSMCNGFQDEHEMVVLENVRKMLFRNGYKYPERFRPSIFSRFGTENSFEDMFEDFEEENYIPIIEEMFSRANSTPSMFQKLKV